MRVQLLLAILLILVSIKGSAEFKDHGQYRVHYTTFASTLIPADVASLHNITRAENQIVLNVSVMRGEEPVAVLLSGEVTNLLNQQYDLKFSEVNEADAIYYLANHLAIEQDILRFTVSIELPDADTLTVRFLRRYD